MESTPAPGSSDQSSGSPAAEVLKPRAEDGSVAATPPAATVVPATSDEGKKIRRRTYRPSHRATFIALGVVAGILAINGAVLGFVLKNKDASNNAASGQVTISADVLNQIGVNKNTIGNSTAILTVGPDAQFKGKLSTAGDVNIGGQLKLNSKFSAADAALAQLEAGNTSLSKLNVSGDSTLTGLVLRNNLQVTGTSQFLGAVTMASLLTINNSLNVVGNLAVGGTISTAGFTARNLASTGTLTIGGHVITSGSIPSLSPGSALGSNGTAAMNGNDSAGTISIAIGVGASSGTIGTVAFKTQYNTVPRIVITGVGTGATFYITNPSTGGFGVSVASALPPGGYAINYIVVQ